MTKVTYKLQYVSRSCLDTGVISIQWNSRPSFDSQQKERWRST